MKAWQNYDKKMIIKQSAYCLFAYWIVYNEIMNATFKAL